MKQRNRQLTLMLSFFLLLIVIFTQISFRKNILAKEIEEGGNLNECLTLKAQGYCSSCKSNGGDVYTCVVKASTPTKTKTSSGSVSSGTKCSTKTSGVCAGKTIGSVCNDNGKKTCVANANNVCRCGKAESSSSSSSSDTESDSSSDSSTDTDTSVTDTPTPTPTTEVTDTPTPTTTLTPTPTVCATRSSGDGNCDGSINGVDFSVWLNSQCSSSCSDLDADFNSDSIINESDYYVWFTNRE